MILTEETSQQILTVCHADRIISSTKIQDLWSGYGQILRCVLDGGTHSQVIVKQVQLPEQNHHPRGWNTDQSHQRKLKSYQIEMQWYQELANHCDQDSRIPKLLHAHSEGYEMLMIMEDLNIAGFPVRLSAVDQDQIKACLKWLAHFHAKYMGIKDAGVWEIGTYWHLATRQDEWEAMQNQTLKAAANNIGLTLNQSEYQTIVHGDAKLANFCFAVNGTDVAAVDFQYVGHGCGIKDVAYFLSSCLNDEELSTYESELLDYYFKVLNSALGKTIYKAEFVAIQQEWSQCYAYAWADFYRFLDGWSPGHWKMHKYSQQMAEKVLNEMTSASDI